MQTNHAAVICTRTRLKRGCVLEVREWLNTLKARKFEVIETFRSEGVWIESAFLEKVGEDDYLIYYMRADDVQKAIEIFQNSAHSIDVFHKECWMKYAEETTVLEPVFDLKREPFQVGQIRAEDVLVDVIALSKQLCSSPMQGSLAYACEENFVGRVVDGYSPDAKDVCLLTRKAAEQLCVVQNALNKRALGIFIFDAYRPLRAVRDFSSWYQLPPANEHEKKRKEMHFPHLEKTDLVHLGYAPDTVSRHCFGNSVDLSLIDLNTNELLDMGRIFDYFDSTSHHPDTPAEVIGQEAFYNRQLLAQAMQECGFVAYPYEYWHFDYQEREIDEPLDAAITVAMKGLNVSMNLSH